MRWWSCRCAFQEVEECVGINAVCENVSVYVCVCMCVCVCVCVCVCWCVCV